MKKVKVIFERSTKAGNNPGDSAMLSEADAKKVVASGDARYDKAPAKKKAKATK